MTDQDLDQQLRGRLERLAGAVPIWDSATVAGGQVVRGPVVGTARALPSGLAVAGVLVAVVAIAVGATVIGRPSAPGSTTPSPSLPADPVSSVARDDLLELTITSPRARYGAFEAIEIEASLAYIGSGVSIDVFHALGAAGGPLGFGINEPVVGGLELGPSWRESCNRSVLAAAPLSASFTKSGGWSGDDPLAADYEAYMRDPELRLPPGTWHVYAVAQLSIGECGGEAHDLRAEIAIVVGEGTEASDAPSFDLTDPSARAYPEGCTAFDLEPDRCARIANWAIDESGDAPDDIGYIELFDSPGALCGDSATCPPSSDGFIVRVRVVLTDDTWTDHSHYCRPPAPGSLGGPIGNGLCSKIVRVDEQGVEHPDPYPPVRSPTIGGYRDVPCSGEAPIGCATPLPSLEPAAVDGARPLTIDDLDIPIDHVGTYSIALGTATLANGILDTATLDVTSSPLNPLISSEGYHLEIESLEGGPPFDNYYLRGWHPGTEEVEVTLTLTVNWFEPGAVIHVVDVDVH